MFNKKILAIAIIILGFSSCSDWLDINNDPTVPANVSDDVLLTGAQVSLSTEIGGQYQLRGGLWAQHFTQSNGANQYKDEDSYNISSSTLNGEYAALYTRALYDLKLLEERAKINGNNGLRLISVTLQAYTFQYLADLYEEIPYFQALQGDKGVLAPRFDHGKDIYADLLKRLDDALNADFTGPENVKMGSNDLIFKGDVNQWVAFANTLKLKLAIRQQKVIPEVLAAIDLDNTPFLTVDAGVSHYKDEPGRNNPLYDSEYVGLGGANLRASNTLLKFLQTNGDPRLSKIYDPKPNKGTYLGLDQGDFKKPSSVVDPMKLSSLIISKTDAVYFLSASESCFLQAEAYLTKGNAEKAEEYYKKGVAASFTRFGVSGSDLMTQVGGTYEFEGLESIITQKWVALTHAEGMEAFFEYNRTGFPTVFTSSKSSVLTNPTDMIRRLRFPEYEKTSNAANVPVQKPVQEKLWWGK